MPRDVMKLARVLLAVVVQPVFSVNSTVKQIINFHSEQNLDVNQSINKSNWHQGFLKL